MKVNINAINHIELIPENDAELAILNYCYSIEKITTNRKIRQAVEEGAKSSLENSSIFLCFEDEIIN